MPFESDKQRKLIYAKAAEGKPWAKKFIKDSGHTPPKSKSVHRKGGRGR